MSNDENQAAPKKFQISNVGDCRNDTQYGFQFGRPCVLVKMNKVSVMKNQKDNSSSFLGCWF